MTNIHVSAGGVVYRKAGDKIEILLLRRHKTADWPYESWHLPKGTVEKDESIEDTARREVMEESGYEIEMGAYLGALPSTIERDGEIVPKTTHYFLCTPIRQISKELSEHDEADWVEIDDALRLVSTFPLWENEKIIIGKAKELLCKSDVVS